MARRKIAFRAVALTISCTDRVRSEHFYSDILGGELEPGDGNGPCRSYRFGSLSVSIMPNADSRSPAKMPEHAMAMLWLEVDDLEVAHAHLAKQKVQILEPPNGLYMIIADPDGLVIEVWQAEPNEVAS